MPKVKNPLNLMNIPLASNEEFFRAVATGDIKTIDSLYFTDNHLAAKNKANFTALHLAVIQSNELLVDWLLKQGTDPNLVDDLGHTPLHLATIMGDELNVSRLLNSHAQINIKDEYGYTPLKLAAKLGHVNIVTLLENRINFLVKTHLEITSTETVVKDQQQAITTLTRTKDVNLTYIFINHSTSIPGHQNAKEDSLICILQETIHFQQQEIQSIKNDAIKKYRENFSFSQQMQFFHQSVNLNNTTFAPQFNQLELNQNVRKDKFM